jgi:hypothetical protein
MFLLLIALALVPVWSMAEEAAKEADTKDVETIDLFNGKDFDGWHMHLEDSAVDPKTVWEVRDSAIWCKGVPNGYIRTKEEYGDFKLVLEWKWPEKPTNSGVLVRISGEDKVWPLSLEAQLMHKKAGDVVGMGCDFNENIRPAGEFFRVAPKQKPTNEKEPGEWNTYEITVKGDTAELIVNGELQNKATGVKVEPKGYIGFQSEGSPIMFRNIKLTPLP